MSDIRSYLGSRSIHDEDRSHTFLNDEDLRSWITDCECARCKATKYEKSHESEWAVFKNIEVDGGTDLFAEETLKLIFLILPNRIPAYVFRTRTWGEFGSAFPLPREYLLISHPCPFLSSEP